MFGRQHLNALLISFQKKKKTARFNLMLLLLCCLNTLSWKQDALRGSTEVYLCGVTLTAYTQAIYCSNIPVLFIGKRLGVGVMLVPV